MTKINVPYNKTYQKQNQRLVPYSFRKGYISAVYITTNSADVYFIGNSQTVVKNVPFATNVNVLKVNVGDKCKIDIFDATNPNDMVVAYTYGNNNSQPVFATGFSTVTQGVTTTIPHGLGTIPNFVTANFTVAPIDGSFTANWFVSVPADNTNIYLSAIFTGVAVNLAVQWFAAKF